MSIEILESRIALSAVFKFTDVDGDLVTVKTSKGTNDQLAAIINPHLVAAGSLGGKQLQEIDFSADGPTFAGTDVTITAAAQDLTPGDADKTKSGDGLVNVGYIDAANSDGDGSPLHLGAIKIAGDLEQIAAGTGSPLVPAVKSLNVRSLGDGRTNMGALVKVSQVLGAIGSITVKNDVRDMTIEVKDGGAIGPVSIGGSFSNSSISTAGDLASVKIAGTVETSLLSGANVKSITIGGSAFAMDLFSQGALGPVKIGGDFGGVISSVTIASVAIGGSLGYFAGPAGIPPEGIFASGKIGSISIGGDFVGSAPGGFSNYSARISTASGSGADIGSIRIGGSILGGSDNGGASIQSDGGIGSLKVGRDIQGGSGMQSGFVTAKTRIGSLTVGGSLVGGNDSDTHDGLQEGFQSGEIHADTLDKVTIGGSVLGGNAPMSGFIDADTRIDSISVGGSVIGGQTNGEFAPAITGNISGGDIGSVRIGRDLVGSNEFGSQNSGATGVIEGEHIGSVTIGGSIIAGTGASLVNSGGIVALQNIGTLVVKGSLIGNGGHNATIFAHGQAGDPVENNFAIKSISIGGRVEHAWIFGGVSGVGAADNGNAQIGAVSVAGDWIASSMEAGGTSTDGELGDNNDAAFGGGTMSKIASIVIKGQVLGEAGTNNTSGFFAETIGSFKYNGITVPLKAGASNDTVSLGAAHAVGASLSNANADSFAVHVFEV